MNENDSITTIQEHIETKKRKRGTRACDLCRKKKVKCHFQPGQPCLNCIAYEEVCIFTKESKKRGPPRGQSNDLEKRIRSIESMTQRIRNKKASEKSIDHQQINSKKTVTPLVRSTNDIQNSMNDNDNDRFMETKYQRQQSKSYAAFSKHMQRLDSLQSRQWPPGTTYDSIYYLGEMAELQFLSGKIKLDDNSKWKGHRIKRFGDKIVLVADGVNEQNLSGIKIPHFEWNNVAPNALGIHGYIYNVTGVDQHTSTRLLKIYFANVHPILPVINKIEFLKQYRDQTETYPSGELLNAMFGAAARFVECEYLEPDRLKKVPKDTIWDVPMGWSDHFFNQAQDIVSRWTVNPTSSKIQAIVLIHNHRGNLDSKSSACWLMGGFAIRLAQMLGLHRNCDDWDISDSEKETRKRLWWALYVSDRFQSALQGKPLSIQDENDVGYPNASATWKEVLDEGDTDIIGPRFPSATYQPQDTNGTVEIYQLFIQFVKLSEILGRIIQGLYSPKMQNAWSKGSMDGLVTRLDHELTEWRFSFSRALRQSRNEDFDEHTGYFTPVTASMLLFYFSALILLHRPFIQFSATGKPISKSSFSSFQICTSAATRGIRIAAGLSIHDFLLCPYSFSLYPVMQCCLIHIYNTRSTDTQISRAAKLDLNRGMDLLDKLQYMSSSAKKLNILLRNIIDNNNIPPSNRDTSLSPLVNVINRTSTSSSSESLPQNKENTIDQSTFHTSTTTPSVSSFLDTNLIQNWQNRQTKSSSFAGNEDQYYQEAYTLQQFGFTAPTKEKNDQKSTLSKFQTFENNDDSLISPLSSTKSQSDNISAVSFAPIQQPTDILDDVLFKYDQNNPFWNIPSSMNWEEWNEWLEKSIDPM